MPYRDRTGKIKLTSREKESKEKESVFGELIDFDKLELKEKLMEDANIINREELDEKEIKIKNPEKRMTKDDKYIYEKFKKDIEEASGGTIETAIYYDKEDWEPHLLIKKKVKSWIRTVNACRINSLW